MSEGEDTCNGGSAERAAYLIMSKGHQIASVPPIAPVLYNSFRADGSETLRA